MAAGKQRQQWIVILTSHSARVLEWTYGSVRLLGIYRLPKCLGTARLSGLAALLAAEAERQSLSRITVLAETSLASNLHALMARTNCKVPILWIPHDVDPAVMNTPPSLEL